MRIFFPLTSPVVLAVALHAIPRLLAYPLSSSNVSTKSGPTTDISPLSIPPSSPTDRPLTSLNKYVFPLEGAGLVLTISLGASLDKVSLASFLAVTIDHVQDQRARFGPNAHLPSGWYDWDMGEEIGMVAESPTSLDHHMTWSILENVLRGLQEVTVEKKNYREVACRVNMAGPAGSFLGYVDVGRRSRRPRADAVRRSFPQSAHPKDRKPM